MSGALPHLTVLRVSVARSASNVWKLCTGWSRAMCAKPRQRRGRDRRTGWVPKPDAYAIRGDGRAPRYALRVGGRPGADFDELDEELPQVGRILGTPIGAQEIATFA